jgi:PhoH-like ATPase
LGFLPGDINEKFAPWIQPIYDALEVIENNKDPKRQSSKTSGIIEVEPLTYIRGRSIPKQFIIVDECQNLTPLEIKTVLLSAIDPFFPPCGLVTFTQGVFSTLKD